MLHQGGFTGTAKTLQYKKVGSQFCEEAKNRFGRGFLIVS